MNLSELFVRRPVMTVLVMAGILIFGLASYRLLPVSSLPNVDFPTIQVSAQLPGASPETMAAAVATPLEKQFSTIAGVAQVQLQGQQKYAVRVQVDPNALAARGVGINEVEQAVANANVNLPTGTLYGKDRMFAIQATGQLYDAAAFRPIIVTYRNGAPIRLSELGRVIDSVENDKLAAWFKDQRGIILAIYPQPAP